MKNFPLLIALDNAIMVSDNEKSSELKTMKINEMERILREEKAWDSNKKIYLTNNGYYKSRLPKQICRKNKNEIIEEIFYYFYQSKTREH